MSFIFDMILQTFLLIYVILVENLRNTIYSEQLEVKRFVCAPY